MNGRIVMLNGTLSSGKTTLAQALRAKLPPSFCYYASDQLADARFRPLDSAETGSRKRKVLQRLPSVDPRRHKTYGLKDGSDFLLNFELKVHGAF